jgi:hypothetical protein
VRGDDGDDGPGDFVLDSENIFELAIVALGPAVRVSDCVDELASDPDSITGAANAPFEDIADAELAAYLPDVGRFPLYWKLELRAMTKSSEKRDSSVMMSSMIPSLK